MIKYKCKCGNVMDIPDSYLNKQVKCPKCLEVDVAKEYLDDDILQCKKDLSNAFDEMSRPVSGKELKIAGVMVIFIIILFCITLEISKRCLWGPEVSYKEIAKDAMPRLSDISPDKEKKNNFQNRESSSKDTTLEDRMWSAITIAEEEIKTRLKAPRTAKFPWGRDDRQVYIDDNTYLVVTYVDAQNSFGAMIRTKFIVELEYLYEDTFRILSVETEEDLRETLNKEIEKEAQKILELQQEQEYQEELERIESERQKNLQDYYKGIEERQEQEYQQEYQKYRHKFIQDAMKNKGFSYNKAVRYFNAYEDRKYKTYSK